MSVGKLHALRSQGIHVWRLDPTKVSAKTLHIADAPIIGQNEDHVWFGSHLLSVNVRSKTCGQDEKRLKEETTSLPEKKRGLDCTY